MDVFQFDDYRMVLRSFIEQKKLAGENLNYSKLAKAIGIQKSYLSQALAGRCDLSSDQLYTAAQFMGCNEAEIEYLLLLLEYARTRLGGRRQQLFNQIQMIRKSRLGRAS